MGLYALIAKWSCIYMYACDQPRIVIAYTATWLYTCICYQQDVLLKQQQNVLITMHTVEGEKSFMTETLLAQKIKNSPKKGHY